MKVYTSIGTIEADRETLLTIYSAFTDKASYLDWQLLDVSAKFYRKVAKEIRKQVEPTK